MYDQNSFLIAAALFVSMVAAIEVGYRLGLRNQVEVTSPSKSHIDAVQASLLGMLALLLGFTFSLALQRFDSRSEAVVDEANAIGTAYLRAALLPDTVREEVTQGIRSYLDLRVRSSAVSLDRERERHSLMAEAARMQDQLWRYAVQAAAENPNPVTTGLFIQALNEMIDSFGRRDAALRRHVPELVLFLLYGAFLMTGSIVGYTAGVASHRASAVTYVLVTLIVLLVFIIIDLDRPRRGLIAVSQDSLLELQQGIRVAPGL